MNNFLVYIPIYSFVDFLYYVYFQLFAAFFLILYPSKNVLISPFDCCKPSP